MVRPLDRHIGASPARRKQTTFVMTLCIASTPNNDKDENEDSVEHTPGTYHNTINCEDAIYMA